MKTQFVLTLSLLAGVRVSDAGAQGSGFVTPLGIPTPSFGITEVAPQHPLGWAAPARNFYYVDETVAAATDLSNPFGWRARPRRTIPNALPAGAVVELHGTYSVYHSSPRGIMASGTAASPVFIRGVSATARPVITSCWELSGTYYIVENMQFIGCGGVLMLPLTNGAALRYSEVSGNPWGGGLGILSWTGERVNDVTIWGNTIHDNGDLNASFDQDVHGIAVGPYVNNVWIMYNDIYRNSGDGIQINAGSAALQATTHHIYVGRNASHDNKQSGFWTKQATDVIFTQNAAFNHRPSNSSLGACMGGQYAPDHVWFINNAIWDCDFGIQLASDAGLGTGQGQFFIGNLIFRIHDSDGNFESTSAWQNCAISLPGGIRRYVMENTIYDVDSGICAPGDGGAIYIFDNLIQNVRWNHSAFDSPILVRTTDNALGNVFAPTYREMVSGQRYEVGPGRSARRGENIVVSDIGFVNPARFDFHLTIGSAAVDNGVMNQLGIWDIYQRRYGVSLSRDVYGVTRSATVPDSGAVERP